MASASFEGLQIWQEARRLTKRVYDVTKQASFSKDFGLINQLRKASISIGSSIAEGYERGDNQDFLQFLSAARGSSGEVRSHLYLVLDQGYMEKQECEEMMEEFKKLSIMIYGFMKYLKTAPDKSTKYKTAEGGKKA